MRFQVTRAIRRVPLLASLLCLSLRPRGPRRYGCPLSRGAWRAGCGRRRSPSRQRADSGSRNRIQRAHRHDRSLRLRVAPPGASHPAGDAGGLHSRRGASDGAGRADGDAGLHAVGGAGGGAGGAAERIPRDSRASLARRRGGGRPREGLARVALPMARARAVAAAARAGQHRSIRPDRGKPFPRRHDESAQHLLDRRRRRLVQQCPAISLVGAAAARPTPCASKRW